MIRNRDRIKSRAELVAVRAAAQRAIRESNGAIPADLLTILVRAGLVLLDSPASSGAAAGDGRSVCATLRWPYRTILAKLQAGKPVTLDELVELNLLTVTEAADVLCVSAGTVQALVRDQVIASFRIHARAIRIPAGAVVEHLAHRLTIPSKSAADASTPASAVPESEHHDDDRQSSR
jgi:excisionase family DNA binding protein